MATVDVSTRHEVICSVSVPSGVGSCRTPLVARQGSLPSNAVYVAVLRCNNAHLLSGGETPEESEELGEPHECQYECHARDGESTNDPAYLGPRGRCLRVVMRHSIAPGDDCPDCEDCQPHRCPEERLAGLTYLRLFRRVPCIPGSALFILALIFLRLPPGFPFRWSTLRILLFQPRVVPVPITSLLLGPSAFSWFADCPGYIFEGRNLLLVPHKRFVFCIEFRVPLAHACPSCLAA